MVPTKVGFEAKKYSNLNAVDLLVRDGDSNFLAFVSIPVLIIAVYPLW